MAFDPRLSVAFDTYATRLRNVIVMRVAIVLVVLGVALYVRHWGAWVLFGAALLFVGVPGGVLTYVRGALLRSRASLEGDPSRIAWLHTAKEPRTNLHRIELHDRVGEVAYLFVPEPIAVAAADAARELSHRPLVTTSDEERQSHEAAQRLAGKLGKLEEAARAAEAPRLREQRERVDALVVACRSALDRPPLPAGLEAGIDRLLHLYSASRLGEDHRKKMTTIAEEKRLPSTVFAPEHFTDEIAALVAELQAKVDAPQPRAE
jgi:hypothetical protein